MFIPSWKVRDIETRLTWIESEIKIHSYPFYGRSVKYLVELILAYLGVSGIRDKFCSKCKCNTGEELVKEIEKP